MPRFVRNPWFIGLLVLYAVGWVIFGFQYYDYRRTEAAKDDPCFAEDGPRTRDQGKRKKVLNIGETTEVLALRFGQDRGTARDTVHFDVAEELPQRLAIRSTALQHEEHTIDRKYIKVRARALRDRVVIDACVDARGLGRIRSGTYEGLAIVTDRRVSGLAMPMTLTVQARYLPLLAFFIPIMPLLGLILVWTTMTPKKVAADVGKGGWVTYITAVGATAVAYNAAGLENPAWGGVVAAAALVAAMYTAATAVTATLGGGGKLVEIDQQGGGDSTGDADEDTDQPLDDEDESNA